MSASPETALSPREALLSAWKAWEDRPSAREAVVALQDAEEACAARLEIRRSAFHELLILFRRAGLGREDALECSIPAGRALAERHPTLSILPSARHADNPAPVPV